MKPVPPLSRFEESPFRRALVDLLREVEVGEMVPYAEMSALLGDDVRNCWHLVTSAREALLREGIAFDVVTNVGLKRLDDTGKVAAAEGYLSKGRNAARRSMRMLRASDVSALSPADRTRYLVAEVRAGAVLQFGSNRGIKQITAAIESGATTRRLKESLRDTLSQFGAQS